MVTYVDGKIWEALRTVLDSMAVVAIYPGQDYEPVIGTPFVDVTDMRLETNRRFVGSGDSVTYPGELQMVIVAPFTWTYTQRLAIADQIKTVFPQGLRLYKDGVVIETDKEASVMTGFRDGAWWRIPVTLRWRATV